MSTTYTPNVQLGQPALGDTGWSVPLNANCTQLDSLTPVGSLAVTLTEVPSATLNVKVAAGSYSKQDGTVGTYAGTSSKAMTASSTQYLYLDLTSSGALTVTDSLPTTAHIRLAVVVAGASTITSITDARIAFNIVGTVLDGTNWTFGTSTGTQIGTATTQKLGFYGKTPIVQPTMGTATASSTYTSVEQGMLNAVHAAVRALGLGS